VIGKLIEIYQFFWMIESHAQQRLAWEDAEKARIARERAELLAAAQTSAMLEASPSGQLGGSIIDDAEALKRAGLI
jgi:hypothetical protein